MQNTVELLAPYHGVDLHNKAPTDFMRTFPIYFIWLKAKQGSIVKGAGVNEYILDEFTPYTGF